MNRLTWIGCGVVAVLGVLAHTWNSAPRTQPSMPEASPAGAIGRAEPVARVERALAAPVVLPSALPAPLQEPPLPTTWAAPPQGCAFSESCPACPAGSSHPPQLPGTPVSVAGAQAAAPAGLPEVQPSPEEETLIREKLAPFARWAEGLGTPEAGVSEAETLETGKKLARQRREALKQLIRSDPRLALRQALPYAVRRSLPPEVRDLVEQPVTGKGNLLVAVGLPIEPGAPPAYSHIAQFGPTKTYQAYVYGRRAERTARMNVSLHGVAVDGELAVSESPLRVLDPGEPPSAGKAQAGKRCPVSGTEVSLAAGTGTSSAAVIAESGDRVNYLCSPTHLAPLAEQVTAQEAAASVPLGFAGGNFKMAVIIVNFLDYTISTTPQDMDYAMFAAPDSVNAAYKEMSFNQVWISGDSRSTLLNRSINDPGFTGDMAIAPAGVDPSLYHGICYILPAPMMEVAGLASIGGNPATMSINSSYATNKSVLAHELGHNVGMDHASTQGDQYGDKTDFMGSSWSLPHVNGPHKVQMGWAQWNDAAASGSYTVSLLEQSGFGTQVLIVPKTDTKDYYFVSFRMPVGFDASQLPSIYTNKVSIHRWKCEGLPLVPVWNQYPGWTVFLQTLDDGQTFTDSVNGISIGLVSHNATHATVDVSVLSPIAPRILLRPLRQTVTAGQTATFSVRATGTAPLSYQWQKYPGVNIPGATAASYTTPPTTPADSGSGFAVVVSNVAGSVASSDYAWAWLQVNAPVAPAITAQPASVTVTEGMTAAFSVTATGTAPLSYQWRKNGASIGGATASTYTTPATTLADSGSVFSVLITNTAGSATSDGAILTVTSASDMLAHWKLDETAGTVASDSSGNGNTGTLLNGPAWTSGGRIGGALSFDGINDYVDYGSGAGLNFGSGGAFSYTGWVKTTEGYGPILSQRNSAEGGAVLSVCVGYDGAVASAGRLMALVRQNGGTGGFARVTGAMVNDGQWHAFALTRSGSGQIELFLDGVSQGTNTGTQSAGALTTNLRALGSERSWVQDSYGTADQQYLNGALDDVRIYNRALAGTEIAALAKASKILKSDFDGDGKADMLFRHPSAGQVVLWLLK